MIKQVCFRHTGSYNAFCAQMIWCSGDGLPTHAIDVSMQLIDGSQQQQSPPTPGFTSFGQMLEPCYLGYFDKNVCLFIYAHQT